MWPAIRGVSEYQRETAGAPPDPYGTSMQRENQGHDVWGRSRRAILVREVSFPMAAVVLPNVEAVPGMERVEKRLFEVVTSPVNLMSELLTYLLRSGGKRLRPMLVMICGSFRPCDEDLLTDVATAVELIHIASLVHDDIIDGAQVRRGRETPNARWGNHTSVLAGDFLFARALSLLCARGRNELVEVLADAIVTMCEGEIDQIAEAFNPDLTEEDYFEQIRRKTAHLIGASCYAGALASGAEEAESALLLEYGLELGYAFQITDDVLDFVGKPEALGKPVGADLAQGILTLPVLHLLKDPACYSAFADRLRRRAFTSQDIQEILKLVRERECIDYALKRAKGHIEAAKAQLCLMPEGPAKGMLWHLADMVLSRSA